jgi:hypothetical protein
MVTLWGSKKNDDDAADEPRSEAYGEAPPRNSEADERTRLLPPQARQDGFLSPDDPAVSYSYSRIGSQRN